MTIDAPSQVPTGATGPTAGRRSRGAGAGWLDRLQHRLHLQDLVADAGLSHGLDLLRDSQRRLHRWFTISAAMGLIVGLAIAGLTWLVEEQLWGGVHDEPPALLWVGLIPLVGLGLARLLLLGSPGDRSDGATTEAYIGMIHARTGRLRLRDLWAKLLATVATLGSGGSLGLEGPGVLTGATVGAHTQARFARLFAGEDGRLLMVAGAAAGMAATFRAPVTGLIFALEVPYKDDLARHAVLPAIVASAFGYLGQAIIFGTQPIFPVGVVPAFRGVDLIGTFAVGIACGLGAQLFVRAVRWTEDRVKDWSGVHRWAIGGGVLAAAAVVSTWVWGRPEAVGIGYQTILDVIPSADPASTSQFASAWGLGLLLGLKSIAVIATLIGGGVGGVFTALVLMGATVGSLTTRAVIHVFPTLDTALFPLVGMAAFLGAAYHTPLAAVAFVAETTGSANYIVAGLLAAALAYGLIGQRSISRMQRTARRGRIEQLLDVPVSTAISQTPVVVPPSTTLDTFVSDFVVRYRHREYPVAEDGLLLGLVALDHLSAHPEADWATMTVADVMEKDPPRLGRNQSLTVAAELMASEGRDRIPVVDDLGRIIGIIGHADVFRLGEVLDEIARSRGN